MFSKLKLLRQQVIREQRASRINSAGALLHCIEYEIAVQQKGITDTISFRLYDNGCAFRYKPAGAVQNLVQEELTSFSFSCCCPYLVFQKGIVTGN